MIRAATLLALLLLTGCASMSTETRYTEAAWQTLNAADAVVTDQNINKSPCCAREVGEWGYLVGEYPNTTQVYAVAALSGVLHFGVTAWLADVGAPRWVQRGWQLVTLTQSGIAVSKGFGLHRELRRQEAHDSTPRERHVDTQPVMCGTGGCK